MRAIANIITPILIALVVLAFIAYRANDELHIISPQVVEVEKVVYRDAVKAPEWISRFAEAFCFGGEENLAYMAENSGGNLLAQFNGFVNAYANKDWTCTDTRYLGTLVKEGNDLYFFVFTNEDGFEWWLLTTREGRVTDLE